MACINNRFVHIAKEGEKVFSAQCLMIKNVGTAKAWLNNVWPLAPGESFISNLQPGMTDCTTYDFRFENTKIEKIDPESGQTYLEDSVKLLAIAYSENVK